MAGLETLDEAAPRDTDAVSLGDDSIRETRQKTKTSVGVEHYLDGPHKIPGGTTAQRPAAGRAGRVYFNTDTKAMEYDDGATWSGSASTKARATILWHAAQFGIPQGATRFEVPFDYIIDDPGGYAAVQYHQIVQPVSSMGIVSLYLEFAPPTNYGFGIPVYLEQFDGTNWQQLVYGHVSAIPAISLTTMVDSRWGLQLRATITNVTGAAMYVNATALGASPRLSYAMLGSTS